MVDYIEYEVRVFADGSRHWLSNDERHRQDGPAIEWADGTKEWWLYDEQVTEQDFVRKINAGEY